MAGRNMTECPSNSVSGTVMSDMKCKAKYEVIDILRNSSRGLEVAENTLREVGDLLKCCVCMSHFKDPVLLPCAHHICRDCMIGVLKQTRTCPFCRLEFIHRQVLNEFTGHDVMGVLQGSFDSMGIPLTQTQVLTSLPPRPLLQMKGGALNGNAMNRRRGRRRRNRNAPISSFQPPLPFDKIPGPPKKNGESSNS
eukprot:351485_1